MVQAWNVVERKGKSVTLYWWRHAIVWCLVSLKLLAWWAKTDDKRYKFYFEWTIWDRNDFSGLMSIRLLWWCYFKKYFGYYNGKLQSWATWISKDVGIVRKRHEIHQYFDISLAMYDRIPLILEWIYIARADLTFLLGKKGCFTGEVRSVINLWLDYSGHSSYHKSKC